MCCDLINLRANSAAAVLRNLTLEKTNEVTCPGGEAVFTCTATSNDFISLGLIWREAGTTTPVVVYLYELPHNLVPRQLDDFTTNASIVPPNYTLLSTATLRGAQFNHDKFVIECSFSIFISHQLVVRVAGKPLKCF